MSLPSFVFSLDSSISVDCSEFFVSVCPTWNYFWWRMYKLYYIIYKLYMYLPDFFTPLSSPVSFDLCASCFSGCSFWNYFYLLTQYLKYVSLDFSSNSLASTCWSIFRTAARDKTADACEVRWSFSALSRRCWRSSILCAKYSFKSARRRSRALCCLLRNSLKKNNQVLRKILSFH